MLFRAISIFGIPAIQLTLVCGNWTVELIQNVGLEDYNNISDGIFPHFTTLSIKISLVKKDFINLEKNGEKFSMIEVVRSSNSCKD